MFLLLSPVCFIMLFIFCCKHLSGRQGALNAVILTTVRTTTSGSALRSSWFCSMKCFQEVYFRWTTDEEAAGFGSNGRSRGSETGSDAFYKKMSNKNSWFYLHRSHFDLSVFTLLFVTMLVTVYLTFSKKLISSCQLCFFIAQHNANYAN